MERKKKREMWQKILGIPLGSKVRIIGISDGAIKSFYKILVGKIGVVKEIRVNIWVQGMLYPKTKDENSPNKVIIFRVHTENDWNFWFTSEDLEVIENP